jgi:hypothetical protein
MDMSNVREGEVQMAESLCSSVYNGSLFHKRAYPMASKSQAHETLSLFHQREGVPNIMVMHSSKEQLLGKFCHK